MTCLPCPATKRRALARLLVVLCALSLFAGDLFRGLHLLATRHVLCPEHGELIHAGEETAAPRAPRQGETQELAAVSPDAPADHHHDHCGVAATRPQDEHGSGAAVATIAVLLPSRTATIGVPELPRIVRIPVLAYAPKVSPPA